MGPIGARELRQEIGDMAAAIEIDRQYWPDQGASPAEVALPAAKVVSETRPILPPL